MRDQPQVWQYRPTDTTEPAADRVPTPRDPADNADPDLTVDPTPTGTDTSTDNAWTPARRAEGDIGEPGVDERDLDEPEAEVEPDAEVEASRGDLAADDPDPRDLDARDTDLPDADLPDADPRDRNLRDADLRDRDLRDSDLRDTDGEIGESDDDETAVGVARVPGTVDERTGGRPDADLPADEPAADETATADGSADATAAADERALVDEPVAIDEPGAVGTRSADETRAADETGAADESAAIDATTATDATTGADGTTGAGITDGGGAHERPDGELMPGDVPDSPMAALFDSAAADGFRDRWQRLQMRFVDDPRGAADEARTLTDDIVSALQDALDDRRGALANWQTGQAGDTEELRVAVRRYRDLLDRLLGL